MNRRRCRGAAGILFLLSFLFTGCPKVYRSETVWHADGSVDRAIYQDWEQTPEPVRRSETWQETTAAPEPQKQEKQGWSDPISKLHVKRRDEAGTYFDDCGR